MGQSGRAATLRAIAAIALAAVVSAWLPLTPANAIILPGLSVPFATNEDGGVPESDLVDTDELWVGVTAGPGGGLVCVVPVGLVSINPGDGTLSCAPAFGESAPAQGLGNTVYVPVADPYLRTGDWVIMADNIPPIADRFSDVFHISTCNIWSLGADTCKLSDRAIDQTLFKNKASALHSSAQGMCYAMGALALAGSLALVRWSSSVAYGAGFGLVGIVVFAAMTVAVTTIAAEALIGLSVRDAAKALMQEATCRLAKRWERAANDPPDPDFSVVAPPDIPAHPSFVDPIVDDAFQNLVEQAAYVDALVTADERYQAAWSANDWEGIALQSGAMDRYANHLATLLAQGSDAMRALGDQFAAHRKTESIVTPQQRDEATAVIERVRPLGFSPERACTDGASRYVGRHCAGSGCIRGIGSGPSSGECFPPGDGQRACR